MPLPQQPWAARPYLERPKVTSYFDISSWRYHNILTTCLLAERKRRKEGFADAPRFQQQMPWGGSSPANTNTHTPMVSQNRQGTELQRRKRSSRCGLSSLCTPQVRPPGLLCCLPALERPAQSDASKEHPNGGKAKSAAMEPATGHGSIELWCGLEGTFGIQLVQAVYSKQEHLQLIRLLREAGQNLLCGSAKLAVRLTEGLPDPQSCSTHLRCLPSNMWCNYIGP